MLRKKPVTVIANEQVSFLTAVRWLGAGDTARDRGIKVTCPLCGERDAMRVYPDHGYCFGEQQFFSTVSLLASKWEMDREDAALEALKRIGYVPASYAHLWDEALRDPDPARDDLSAALRTWCEAHCENWRTRQYDETVAGKLARCNGLLVKVQTEEECAKWLATCKVVMGRVLPGG
jgi:hypothetical protein